jgi:chemotaxis protein MotA
MLVIIGAIIVSASVMGGFIMAGGHPIHLLQLSEFVVIAGAALGALITMAPKRVLMDMVKQILATLKGAPHGKAAYEELFKALYELFMLGRRNGMIALEEHVTNPGGSTIFNKYPTIAKNHHALRFLCSGLRPIIDGKVKPDQLKTLMEIELEAMDEEQHQSINVLTKAADAMPGFGIVAAVLGIVITMGSIAGPIEQIGQHVAAALVGTFLGILLSYGFLNPLAVCMEFNGAAELGYARCIAASVIGFANGMAPVMAVEVARRGLSSDVKPSSEELEQMLKSIGK